MSDERPPDSDRRGFFRALREWAAEETKAAAQPLIEDWLERVEPALVTLAGPQIVRPPGAIEERRFRETCTQCGDCIRACPEGSIMPAQSAELEEIAGTPIIIPRRRACYHCKPLHCAEACPSGALIPLPSGHRMKIGEVRIINALCHAHQGRPCDTCHVICPERGKAIVMERGLPRVIPEACTGCGLCEYICPAHPAAIRVFSPR